MSPGDKPVKPCEPHTGLDAARAALFSSLVMSTVVVSRRARSLLLAGLLALACVPMSGCFGLFASSNAHLLESGVRARAVVLSLSMTGTRINSHPVCELIVAVEPAQGEMFNTSLRQLVTSVDMPKVQPGSVLTVRYDPADLSKVIIEAYGEPSKQMSADEAQQALASAQALLEELNAEGSGAIAASAVVLRFESAGVLVNEVGTLATVQVKVLPSDGASFDARILGVFAESALPKYAPGREVHVLYDANNHQRVTLNLKKTRAMISH